LVKKSSNWAFGSKIVLNFLMEFYWEKGASIEQPGVWIWAPKQGLSKKTPWSTLKPPKCSCLKFKLYLLFCTKTEQKPIGTTFRKFLPYLDSHFLSYKYDTSLRYELLKVRRELKKSRTSSKSIKQKCKNRDTQSTKNSPKSTKSGLTKRHHCQIFQ
jgi:hypothetical protein